MCESKGSYMGISDDKETKISGSGPDNAPASRPADSAPGSQSDSPGATNQAPPLPAAPSPPGKPLSGVQPTAIGLQGGSHNVSGAGKRLMILAVCLMLFSSALALYMKLSGYSAQHAFNVNAAGLILAQGVSGPVKLWNTTWLWPAISTVASLLLLLLSYFVPA
jgi:hypothetical protein